MTEDEIRAEITRQLRETLGRLSARLRVTAAEHGPVISKTLNLAADDIDTLF